MRITRTRRQEVHRDAGLAWGAKRMEGSGLVLSPAAGSGTRFHDRGRRFIGDKFAYGRIWYWTEIDHRVRAAGLR